MGKIADAIRGLSLPLQVKTKLLALDKEFSEMITEIQTLKAEKLNLQAKVNPLERQVQGLKQEKEQSATRGHGRLDDLSEKILIEVANRDRIIREELIQHLGLSPAKGNHHFDILEEGLFITMVGAIEEGTEFLATPDGRKYLARHNLL